MAKLIVQRLYYYYYDITIALVYIRSISLFLLLPSNTSGVSTSQFTNIKKRLVRVWCCTTITSPPSDTIILTDICDSSLPRPRHQTTWIYRYRVRKTSTTSIPKRRLNLGCTGRLRQWSWRRTPGFTKYSRNSVRIGTWNIMCWNRFNNSPASARCTDWIAILLWT